MNAIERMAEHIGHRVSLMGGEDATDGLFCETCGEYLVEWDDIGSTADEALPATKRCPAQHVAICAPSVDAPPPDTFELWWCSYCGEPSLEWSDPCQACGESITRQVYMLPNAR